MTVDGSFWASQSKKRCADYLANARRVVAEIEAGTIATKASARDRFMELLATS